MCQDVVERIRLSVDPISGTVCGHIKKVHAGIRLDGGNFTGQVWSMIDGRESSRESRPPLQLMEVSIEVPHDMRYRKGHAKFCVCHLLYLGRAKRQIIQNLRRGNRGYCLRPHAKRERDDNIIPFCSSYLATQSATSER